MTKRVTVWEPALFGTGIAWPECLSGAFNCTELAEFA